MEEDGARVCFKHVRVQNVADHRNPKARLIHSKLIGDQQIRMKSKLIVLYLIGVNGLRVLKHAIPVPCSLELELLL